MIIRHGTEADIEACNDVWVSTQPDLGGEPLPHQPLAQHELDTGRLVVAEVDGAVLGFGATLTRSGVAYLADLFVTPAHQSNGIGRRLMQALFADHRGPLFTFASTDPRAQRLYEQFGMHAIEQYHYLDARRDALAPWATDVELVAADRAAIIAVDSAITGHDRSIDIDYATSIGANWYVARRAGRSIGAVAVAAPTWWNPWHPHGARVGPVMADDAADIAPIYAASLALCVTAHVTADVISTFTPSGLPALPALLRAGFEVVDTDLLMASDDAVIDVIIDRHRYLPSVDTP
jgi:GNAT superfamily N-acetyltransferase